VKIAIEKPGTPEDLVHVGVKGMKWGVRKSQGTREFHQKFPTSHKRAAEIRRARISTAATRQAFKDERNSEKRKQLKDIHLSNPDRATALRLTRGEKVVLALLGSTTAVGGIGLGVAGGTAVRVGMRRKIEP
jgi:hypothetical protein